MKLCVRYNFFFLSYIPFVSLKIFFLHSSFCTILSLLRLKQSYIPSFFSIKAIEADTAEGYIPFFVSTTLGTTACCSFDNLKEIGPVCKKYPGVSWRTIFSNFFILDFENFLFYLLFFRCGCTSMQLTRAILSSARNWSTWWLVSSTRILSTPTRINSYWRTSIVPAYGSGIDSNWPARWSSILFISSTLTRIQLSITGIIEICFILCLILSNRRKWFTSSFVSARHWSIPLSRRFRSLKLWFVMRSYGISGLQAYIRNHVQLAKRFEALVRKDTRFELCNEVVVSV